MLKEISKLIKRRDVIERSLEEKRKNPKPGPPKAMAIKKRS